MKTITIEVDDVAGMSYQNLSQEEQRRFQDEAVLTLKKIITESRSIKIKKIVEEIKGNPDSANMDPDILVELLRTDI